jgi:5-methylcytosine-specific restriction enzyme subunit McrC
LPNSVGPWSYGQSDLDGQGDVVLICPKTAAFDQPLPVFEFPKTEGLRLWVLPFCLKSRQLAVPRGAPCADAFAGSGPVDAFDAQLSSAG